MSLHWKGRKGFGIVEIIVFTTIGSLLVLFLSTFMLSTLKTSRQITSTGDLDSFTSRLRLYLSTSSFCQLTFTNRKFDPTALGLATAEIPNDDDSAAISINTPSDSTIVLAESGTKIAANLAITGIKFRGFVKRGLDSFVSDLQITAHFDRGIDVVRTIPITLATTNLSATSEKIVSCAALSGGDSSNQGNAGIPPELKLGFVAGLVPSYVSNAQIKVTAGSIYSDDGLELLTMTSDKTATRGAGGVNGWDPAHGTTIMGWVGIYIIKNPTTGDVGTYLSVGEITANTIAGLTSSHTPTLPSGYTLKRRIGWVSNNSTFGMQPFSVDASVFPRLFVRNQSGWGDTLYSTCANATSCVLNPLISWFLPPRITLALAQLNVRCGPAITGVDIAAALSTTSIFCDAYNNTEGLYVRQACRNNSAMNSVVGPAMVKFDAVGNRTWTFCYYSTAAGGTGTANATRLGWYDNLR